MKKTAVAVVLVLAFGILGLLMIGSVVEKTVVGTVTKIDKDRTITAIKVTVMTVAGSDGEDYYLGLKGHEPNLKVGDEIEATFLIWDYVARGAANGKPVGYKTIKHYKIISR